MTDAKDYSAKDLMSVADMSYRQLNEWDQKGALPHERSGERGWRRFSPNQIFLLMVCRTLQRRFGIPVERLKLVISEMNAPGRNYANWVSETVFSLGVGVWLFTDLDTYFFIDNEVGLAKRIGEGLLNDFEPGGYVALRVDPLLDLLTQRLGNDAIELHGHGCGLIKAGYGQLSHSELVVIRDIRTGKYRSIEVTLDDGEVRTVKKSETAPPDADLSELLKEHDFQRISIVQSEGRTVAVERQILDRPAAD